MTLEFPPVGWNVTTWFEEFTMIPRYAARSLSIFQNSQLSRSVNRHVRTFLRDSHGDFSKRRYLTILEHVIFDKYFLRICQRGDFRARIGERYFRSVLILGHAVSARMTAHRTRRPVGLQHLYSVLKDFVMVPGPKKIWIPEQIRHVRILLRTLVQKKNDAPLRSFQARWCIPQHSPSL